MKITICSKKRKENDIKYYTRKVLSSTQKREKTSIEVMKQYRCSIQRKNDKSPFLLLITLNANWLNSPIKSWGLAEYI